jgi:hypothetical protein
MTMPDRIAHNQRVLGQAFDDFMTALAEREKQELSPDQAATARDFSEIRQAFAVLRDELRLDPGPDDGMPVNDLADDDSGGITTVDEAMDAASQHVPAYLATPEWQRISYVREAFREFAGTVRLAAESYRDELGADIRARGFLRLVAARTCRVISRASSALADRIDGAGHRGSPAWAAMWKLHRAADNRAAQLMGHIPPGHSLDITGDVAGMMIGLRYRIDPESTRPNPYEVWPKEPGTWDGYSVPGGDLAPLQRAVAAAGRHAAALAPHAAWAQVTSMTAQARDLAAAAYRGAARLGQESTLGTFRALQGRACEIISQGASDLMGRLGAGSPGWHAARHIRDAAAEATGDIRGDAAAGQPAAREFRDLVQVVADINPDEELNGLEDLVNEARRLMGEPPLPPSADGPPRPVRSARPSSRGPASPALPPGVPPRPARRLPVPPRLPRSQPAPPPMPPGLSASRRRAA